MTLCIAWKVGGIIHLASDSRITFAQYSTADVGIKVVSVPYAIYSPSDAAGIKTLDYGGAFGMCFCGSALNAMFIKEHMVEVVKEFQYVPHATNISMEAMAKVIFTAYKIISKEVCATSLGHRGISEMVVAGYCHETSKQRAFYLQTDASNTHSMQEVLTADGSYLLLGEGKDKAESTLGGVVSRGSALASLKSVIDDESIPGVGGHIQYGELEGTEFKTFGVVEFDSSVNYWRGALDLNSPEFSSEYDSLILSYRYLDSIGK